MFLPRFSLRECWDSMSLCFSFISESCSTGNTKIPFKTSDIKPFSRRSLLRFCYSNCSFLMLSLIDCSSSVINLTLVYRLSMTLHPIQFPTWLSVICYVYVLLYNWFTFYLHSIVNASVDSERLNNKKRFSNECR